MRPPVISTPLQINREISVCLLKKTYKALIINHQPSAAVLYDIAGSPARQRVSGNNGPRSPTRIRFATYIDYATDVLYLNAHHLQIETFYGYSASDLVYSPSLQSRLCSLLMRYWHTQRRRPI